jgi:hypothetical protein
MTTKIPTDYKQIQNRSVDYDLKSPKALSKLVLWCLMPFVNF